MPDHRSSVSIHLGAQVCWGVHHNTNCMTPVCCKNPHDRCGDAQGIDLLYKCMYLALEHLQGGHWHASLLPFSRGATDCFTQG